MSRTYDCLDDEQRAEGLRTATTVLGRGGLVVMPTDTLYGVAADAFNPAAVSSLLAAKGRDRNMPPPVLIAGIEVLTALTTDLSPQARRLAEAFWPGGLTLIGWAQPSLAWDLGDTGGTVAVRVPDHPVALDLLRSCGPLATSSANLSGRLPAATAAEAERQLGTDVEVYLEVGELAAGIPSTIVDTTGDRLVVVRAGAVTLEQLREVVPEVAAPGDPEPDTDEPGELNQQDDPDADDEVFATDDPPAAASATADPSGEDPLVPQADSSEVSDTYDARAAFAAATEATPDPGAVTYDARAEYTARHRDQETPTEL